MYAKKKVKAFPLEKILVENVVKKEPQEKFCGSG